MLVYLAGPAGLGGPGVLPVAPAAWEVVLDDFNGDSRDDLAVLHNPGGVATTAPGTLSVLLGNGDGSFQPPQVIHAGSSPNRAAVADLNRDGFADLAVTHFGNGDGTFGPVVQTGLINGQPVVADFDDDGRADLAINNYAGGVFMLLGNGNGGMRTAVSACR